jgi:hypothetical protein
MSRRNTKGATRLGIHRTLLKASVVLGLYG